MLTVMGIWAIYIIVSLLRHDPIETLVWGLPGAVYFAINPVLRLPKSNDDKKE